jgi:hypothetical protein
MFEKLTGSGESLSKAHAIDNCFTNRETRFLRDLKKTARLSGGEKVAAGAVGIFVPGVFAGSSLRPLVRKNWIFISTVRRVCCKYHQEVDEEQEEQTCGRAFISMVRRMHCQYHQEFNEEQEEKTSGRAYR